MTAERSNDTKRVFILGAGFSKQVGMPLATELTDCLLKKFKECDHQEMLNWFEWLKHKINWLEGYVEKINIEQIFDLAQFDIETWKMNQQRCSVGRNCGDTSWDKAESIETWLQYMGDDLIDVIWEKQQGTKDIEKIKNFSRQLADNDIVLTFNYDTILENSLTELQKPWRYGFEIEGGNGIKIFKMHGSLNWLIIDRGKANDFGLQLLFRKEDKNVNENSPNPPQEEEFNFELVHIHDDNLESFVKKRDLQRQSMQYYFAIAGLGTYKPLHKLPGAGEVWFNAMRALLEADKIYVIGFSLSLFDNMSRLNFADVMHSRSEKQNLPTMITLIDPNANRLVENFRSVFGGEIPLKYYKPFHNLISYLF